MTMNGEYSRKLQLSKYLRVCIGLALFALPAVLVLAEGPPQKPPKPGPAQSLNFDFSTPVQLAPVQTAGKWYPDRFAPCGFLSPATAPDGSKNTLEESICAADFQSPGPPVTSNFYDTQGRKYDLLASAYSTTISLYVPSAWATTNARMAGFWATTFESDNATVGDFPIVEFQGAITSGPYANGGVPGFYGWDNTLGAWDFIGLPDNFHYDSWVNVTMTLIAGQGFTYTVSDAKGHRGKTILSPLGDTSDASIGNVILQGYNYDSNYSIFWNNLSISFSSFDCSKGK